MDDAARSLPPDGGWISTGSRRPPKRKTLPVRMEPAKSFRQKITTDFPLYEYATTNILYHADTAQASNICQDNFVDVFPILGPADKMPDWIYYRNLLEIYNVRRYSGGATKNYIFAHEGFANLLKMTLLEQSLTAEHSERYKTILEAAVVGKSPATVGTVLEHEDISYEVLELAMKESTPEVIGVIAGHLSSNTLDTILLQNLINLILERGKERHLVYLLETGTDVDFRDSSHRTILRRALDHGKVQMARVLLDHGAAMELNHDALREVILYRKQDFAWHMTVAWASTMQELSSPHTLLNDLLHAASLCGNLDAVRTLLAMGVPVDTLVNTGHTPRCDTPLGAASFCGQVGTAQTLLAHGADINASKCDGKPICYAASQGQLQMVQFLLDSGADLHTVVGYDREFGNALFHACRNGRIEVATLLLDKGLEVNAVGSEEWPETPLNAACLHGHVDIVELLLERGADPHVQGPLGTAADAAIDGRSYTTADESSHYKFNRILQLLGREY